MGRFERRRNGDRGDQDQSELQLQRVRMAAVKAVTNGGYSRLQNNPAPKICTILVSPFSICEKC